MEVRIHPKDRSLVSYSVEIELANINNPRNTYIYRVVDMVSSLTGFNKDKTELEKILVQDCFHVARTSRGKFLKEYEEQKSKMIAEVTDIKYTQKQYDPCGYKKITLTDQGDSQRAPFVLFDEDELISEGDKTQRTFDIVRGSDKRPVLIALEGLENKGVRCSGVMLPQGERHDKKEHVFLLSKLHSPKKNDTGYIVYENDKTHEQQLRDSGIEVTDKNRHDTDIQLDENLAAIEAALTQGLIEGKDYEYVGEDQLKLNLAYLYNKTYDNKEVPALLDVMWYFRYLWPRESFVQSYIVPISTCRYPNQVAKVRVFPDIEWEVALKYNFKSSLGYNHGNLSDYSVEEALEKYKELAQQDYDIKTQHGALGKFKLALFNPKINQKDLIKIELGVC